MLSILLFTGCTSYTELNNLSIVSTLGIDYQDNQYHLVISVIDGEIDDNSIQKNLTIYESTDDNLEGAFQDIYFKSSKRLYLSHIDLLLLTENAINEKLPNIITNFLENNEYRNNFSVVLLKDANLLEFMQGEIQAEEVNNLLKTNQKETGYSKVRDFETILKDLLIDKNTYLPTILYEEEKIVLGGFTLIKDYQTTDLLDKKESILLNLLTNSIEKSYLNQNNIYENQTLITSRKNQIHIRLITTTDNKNSFKEETKKEIESFLKKYQQKNYDILKLCEMVRKNNYSYYKNEKDLLSKLQFEIEINMKEKENYLEGDTFYEK